MANERLAALAHKAGELVAKAEGLLTRLDEAREDVSEAVDGVVEELRAGLAQTSESISELEARLGEEDGTAA